MQPRYQWTQWAQWTQWTQWQQWKQWEQWDQWDQWADWNWSEEQEQGFLVVEEESSLIAIDQNPDYNGCLVVDTGCSCSVSSLQAAEILQLERSKEEFDNYHRSPRQIRSLGCANGLSHRCVLQVSQDLSFGVLAG